LEAVSATARCLAVLEDRTSLVLNAKPTPKIFTFDYAIHETASQEEIFNAIGRPITSCVLEGYNSTVLAYGQTGSGKSHTMFGPESLMSLGGVAPQGGSGDAMRGLVPRSLEYLFTQIARESRRTNGKLEYSCKCSFFEIFNERVFDLLDTASAGSSSGGATDQARSSSSDRTSGASDRSSRGSISSDRSSRNSSSSFMAPDDVAGMQVREDQQRGVYVDGLTETSVDSAVSAGKALGKGYRNRRVAETAMNRESSRSHAVFQLVVESVDKSDHTASGIKKTKASRFSLVDLAGSERQKSTSATGDRLKEANAINKSLSALGLVINCLVDKGLGKLRHVPYRDSKLTFLLRDSLGGNSRTTLVATVSPAEEQFGESLSTLKFSQRAKMITNTAVVNEDTVGSLETLQKEVGRLRQDLLKAQYALKNGDGTSQQPQQEQQEQRVVTREVDDQLLVATLERFKVVHARSERYQGQKMRAHDLQRKHEELLKVAKFTIKILREKETSLDSSAVKVEADSGPAAAAAALVPLVESDPELSKVLESVEKNLLMLPEAEKWRVACDAMKREIVALTGGEPLTSWMEDLKEITAKKGDGKEMAAAVKEINSGRRARDVSLGLGTSPKVVGNLTGNDSTPKKEEARERTLRLSLAWTPADEATFDTALQDRYAKVVAERDALKLDLEAALTLESEFATQGGEQEQLGSPLTGASHDEELDAMFGANFGSLKDGGSILDSLPKRSSTSSTSSNRRSSVGGSMGGRLSVGGGGRLSVGGSDSVAAWAQTQELQRKLREADGRAEALRREVVDKDRELAEHGRLNSVLAREKAELNAALSASAAAAAAQASSADGEGAENSATDSSVKEAMDAAALEVAVSAAVSEAVSDKDEELAALKEELESNQVARFNDKEAFEQSEATLRALAQDEIENACRLREQHDLAALAAGRENEKAQASADEAAAARKEALEAKEEQETAQARVRELEDEVETLGENSNYMAEKQLASAEAVKALEAKLQGKDDEATVASKALEAHKASVAGLQKQLAQAAEATSHSESEAVESLRTQLAEEAAKVAASLEEAAASQSEAQQMASALAASEARTEELAASLAEGQERESQSNDVWADLTAEVVGLRESVGASEALAARFEAELEATAEDRDEIAKALKEAEEEAELARELLEQEKVSFLEELDKVQTTCNEYEEALEAEQQVLLDAGRNHEAAMEAAAAGWAAEKCSLQAELSCCSARAEKAEAEALVLARDTERGVSEAEKELLACRASLKHEEKRRADAEATGAVSAARAEEQLRTTHELKLGVTALEKERESLLGGVVRKDVELEAAVREAKHLKESLDAKAALLKATECRAQVAEEAVAEKAVAAEMAEAQRDEALDECERLKAMEAEAFERCEAVESAHKLAHAQLDEAAVKICELVGENAALSGHSNPKQKIHSHMKLKDEIIELQRNNGEMHQKLLRAETSEAQALAQLTGITRGAPSSSSVCKSSDGGGKAPPPLPPPPKAFVEPASNPLRAPDENESPARLEKSTAKSTISDLCMSSPQPALALAALSPRDEN